MPTNVDSLVPWTSDFAKRHPMYEPLMPWAEKFARFAAWPELPDYQRILDLMPEPIRTLGGKALRIVPQDGKPGRFEGHYAPRIYLTGEIQTRMRNWHDFFQYLTWFLFPKTKAQINAMHLPRAKARIERGELGRRSPVENMLSLFDEGGAVVVSSNPVLLDLIRGFRWKELFWERRAEMRRHVQCIIFGHAVFEKGLMPYVGLTANCMLLQVEEDFLSWTWERRLAHVDARVAANLERGDLFTEPRDLSPFPLLGFPGWDAANEIAAYYDNTHYFRRGRSTSSTAAGT